MYAVRYGHVVTVQIQWKASLTGSWDSYDICLLPAGWRPVLRHQTPVGGRDEVSQRVVVAETSGSVKAYNRGGRQNGGSWDVTFTYICS